MSKPSYASRIVLCVACIVGSTRCASKIEAFDSESHFLCTTDADCGGGRCIAQHCVESIPSSISSSPPSADGGGLPPSEGAASRSKGDASSGPPSSTSTLDGPTPIVVRDAGGLLRPPARTFPPVAEGGSPNPSEDAGPPILPDAGSLPARLAPIVGVAGDGRGGFLLVLVDPATGGELRATPLPTLTAVVQGGAEFDPATERLYVLADLSDDADHLVGIDVPTGATVTSPAVDPGFGPICLAASERFVGTSSNNTTAGDFSFGTIDVTTGVFSSSSTFHVGGLLLGTVAADPTRGRYYAAAIEDDPPSAHLLTFDTSSGALLYDADTQRGIVDLLTDADGTVVGFDFGSDRLTAASIDPETGATANIGAVRAASETPAVAAIDTVARIAYHEYEAPGFSADRLVAVELADGHTWSVRLRHDFTAMRVCSTCAPVTRP